MFNKVSLAALLTFALTSTAHANLLTNAGFETGNLNGWTIRSNTPLGYGVGKQGQTLPTGGYGPSQLQVVSGTYAVWAATRASNGEFLELSQTLSFNAGTYDIGFTYGSNQGPFGNATGIYLDGSLIATPSSSGNGAISNGFQTEKVLKAISQGTHTVMFRLSGSGTAPVAISADNFYVNDVNAVPEPGSVALLGLGLLGMGVLRRKYKA